MYGKIPFGLKNAGDTFQREMDTTFAKEIHEPGNLPRSYHSFSKSNQQHLDHLRQVFTKCRKYGIYLNPKNIYLGRKRGNY